MKFDALTTAHFYALVLEDIDDIQDRLEHAQNAYDYERVKMYRDRLAVMNKNLDTLRSELRNGFTRKEDAQ